jgi:hypothetical protein
MTWLQIAKLLICHLQTIPPSFLVAKLSVETRQEKSADSTYPTIQDNNTTTGSTTKERAERLLRTGVIPIILKFSNLAWLIPFVWDVMSKEVPGKATIAYLSNRTNYSASNISS